MVPTLLSFGRPGAVVSAHLSPAAAVFFVNPGVKAYSLTMFLSGVGEKMV